MLEFTVGKDADLEASEGTFAGLHTVETEMVEPRDNSTNSMNLARDVTNLGEEKVNSVHTESVDGPGLRAESRAIGVNFDPPMSGSICAHSDVVSPSVVRARCMVPGVCSFCGVSCAASDCVSGSVGLGGEATTVAHAWVGQRKSPFRVVRQLMHPIGNSGLRRV